MIDFACKTFELDEIIKCGLGLTKSDIIVMKFLIERKKIYSSFELAEELNLDASTVQRSLKKLHEKNIIVRYQKNLSKGGYIFTYKMNSKPIIIGAIKKVIHDWVKKVDDELERW
ncbi:winged helix-turn-helix transcriptional regulator [Candidatus Pacearchaeota archaeon]|nr:winged helix-turn-helix transcriptional regulator [Candidatus Pacearchaeota archaeon]MBD3283236.1 winged helix-turn-helix transcriptional regulator [Candidatus Pacearchaeota archaeon]